MKALIFVLAGIFSLSVLVYSYQHPMEYDGPQRATEAVQLTDIAPDGNGAYIVSVLFEDGTQGQFKAFEHKVKFVQRSNKSGRGPAVKALYHGPELSTQKVLESGVYFQLSVLN